MPPNWFLIKVPDGQSCPKLGTGKSGLTECVDYYAVNCMEAAEAAVSRPPDPPPHERLAHSARASVSSLMNTSLVRGAALPSS